MPEDPNDVIRSEGAEGLRSRIDRTPAQRRDGTGETGQVVPLATGHDSQLSEDSMALEFAETHKDRLRYVASWGRWMRYVDGLWVRDETLHTYDAIRPIVRRRSTGVLGAATNAAQKSAARIASAQTVAGVERLAKSDRRLAADATIWDRDPMQLGVPGGVVDLSTGTFREGAPQDYLTRQSGAAPEATCQIPAWTRFVDFVTGGDVSYARYLQRVCGYCLTGSTDEQVLFFLYGKGGNGKSVFVDVIATLLGGYWRGAAMDTFIDTGRSDHPTDLAMLQGARLVTAQETQQGRRWHESRIKQLTGGDPVTARYMRADFFTYRPQFKLMITGNHKPSLLSVDEAICRRMRLLPFEQTVPAESRDPKLKQALLSEAPGIMAWMIEGGRAWQADGLGRCDRVEEATQSYLAEEDALATWMEDCCQIAPDAFAPSSVLFSSWCDWAKSTGEPAGTQKSFSQALQQRGFNLGRRQNARCALGLAPRGWPS